MSDSTDAWRERLAGAVARAEAAEAERDKTREKHRQRFTQYHDARRRAEAAEASLARAEAEIERLRSLAVVEQVVVDELDYDSLEEIDYPLGVVNPNQPDEEQR